MERKDNLISTILYDENGQTYLEMVCMYHNEEWAQHTADRLNKERNTDKYYVGEQEDVM